MAIFKYAAPANETDKQGKGLQTGRACGRKLCYALQFGSIATSVDMEDSVYEELVHYIGSGAYPDNATKNEKRRLREKAASFCVDNSVLMHKGSKGKRQRVVRKDEVLEFDDVDTRLCCRRLSLWRQRHTPEDS